MITIAIAEDHQSLIDGIELLIKAEEDISLVGSANNGEELLKIVRLKQPKVIIMDIRMPKLDGIEATRVIKKEFPHIKVIAFTMFDQEDAVKQMINAGASGYILKHSPLEEILNAIRTVASGKDFYDNSINLESIKDAESSNKKLLLSKSERQILKMVGQGKSSLEIAQLRFTSVSTVEKHRKNMIRKLNLSGKGELLRYALEKKYDF
ncbi:MULTISPECIES: response regulator transcription factor [Croceibacter]|jgi:two-component system response regulator NreC|uniref:Transcriptional regulator n=1 Tax=Croceibacter atlanticus (strain ATCC BAA-628 / JCM 21780 / CIP 108009 / IAM 15332 / KCTC 12090 / HTCC2559) TaxID=216432 RepID=A3UAN1_CROAH|nr:MULTISPECIES: response regulator transcription factor [Croceibacter]HAT70581.1 DNA-binding response regulator [Flavobacteriaceae bacterium]EAP86867.1 Transcriptional regulator [Croceibacter atlanticus HTCC2559]MBG24966.1 DNA-binding response regulator [Croceibacter sp.]MBW4970633.1 response regulator transcription factor [Croceibacter atlanticus]WSP34432.1 response regulator transcription factor [Croceibacter atlanticus]|tara:strand:- start:154 stop:777 length:624 start_codon:yes stop_codon:yes gene_type:complete